MRTTRWFVLVLVVSLVNACGGNNDNHAGDHQCNDGQDNDGDGFVDFPDDPGCTSETDDTENSLPAPQCSDGRDNDGDGKTDFPNDPGCFDPNQDSETDDCPDGPNCPQCSNGKDDDNNGVTDYPNDTGCLSAADTVEFTDIPFACGSNVTIQQQILNGGHITGMLSTSTPSALLSPTCGGAGAEDVYEILISSPKVIVASTQSSATTANTVLYLRSSDCANNTSELACNDDAVATVQGASKLTYSIATPGAYYLVVDTKNGGVGGAYDLQVDLLAGQGEACDPAGTTCGPGLFCRIPLGGTTNLCEPPMCNDGVDDDGDGKADFPDDPGCSDTDDNDETDTCPGAGCPQCGDGIDNDGDGHTDYPDDTNCMSASGASESCVDTDAVTDIAATTTAGTTVGLHNDSHPACASTTTTTAPEKTYRLHLTQQLVSLSITSLASSSFSDSVAVYGPSCGGTALACETFDEPIALTNIAAGDLFVVVDGYSSGSGTFTLNVSGVIKNGESCEGPLVTSGVLTCATSATCTGPAGMKTCVPAQCSDGLDNNGDGKIDYPTDPGCDSPSDNTETTVCPGANCPVCSDTTDNDADGHIDYATDLSCWAASGTNEAFCSSIAETDRALIVANAVTTGTTVGAHNEIASESCQASSGGNDVEFSLTLPVPVTTIQIDTNGTAFDTVLSLRTATCAAATEVECDDDDGDGTQSLITRTNLAAGAYAIVLDGYSTGSGLYQLNVRGTVAAGQSCTSPLFSTGVLKCAGTCNGTVCQ